MRTIALWYNEKTSTEAARIYYAGGFSVQYKSGNLRNAGLNPSCKTGTEQESGKNLKRTA
jgi:hypothetical protein